MSNKQLEEIRLTKHHEYNKKKGIKIQQEHFNHDDQDIKEKHINKNIKEEHINHDDQDIKEEHIKHDEKYIYKEYIEEERIHRDNQEIKEKQIHHDDREIKEEQIKHDDQYYFEKYGVNKGKDSYIDCLCPENEIKIPMNHSELLNDSFVIIFSIFDKVSYQTEFLNGVHDFVQNTIINHLYYQINNSPIDELFTFYVSIKEILYTDNINIDLIFNTLSLIKMDYRFVEILNKSGKQEYINIILQEFIKIIDHIKPEFNY
jgi:hypothetical protein